jgi:hypothetical protein
MEKLSIPGLPRAALITYTIRQSANSLSRHPTNRARDQTGQFVRGEALCAIVREEPDHLSLFLGKPARKAHRSFPIANQVDANAAIGPLVVNMPTHEILLGATFSDLGGR